MRSPLRGFGCVSASTSAATLAGGDSMNLSACPSEMSRDSSSRRSSSSPAQAWSRNEARSAAGRSSAASSNSSTCFHRSGFIGRPFADCPVQPGLCFAPLPLDCAGGNLQYLRHLFRSESAEELHLNNLALARVHFCQIRQRLVEGDHLDDLLRHNRRLSKRHHLRSAAAFRPRATPRVIYQNL